MITYNHESYIAEAIEGVLMQQTTFPIELIISEDYSTDSTREKVRAYADRYPDIIVADLPDKNRGMMNNFYHCISQARGKYIAICDGDDYWIDPLKLQKQVDFLEANIEYGLCYGGISVYQQSTKTFISPHPSNYYKSINYFSDILNFKVSIPTLTACFRKNIITELPILNSESNFTGDVFIWLYISSKYRIHGFAEKFAVYRILEESASHTKVKNIYKDTIISYRFYNMQLYYLDNIYLPVENRNSLRLRCNFMRLKYFLVYPNYHEARKIVKQVRMPEVKNLRLFIYWLMIFLSCNYVSFHFMRFLLQLYCKLLKN